MADLYAEDINVLIEALETWKERNDVTALLVRLIPRGQFAGKFATRKDKWEAQFAPPMAIRTSRAIVLQAKLIKMRMRLKPKGSRLRVSTGLTLS